MVACQENGKFIAPQGVGRQMGRTTENSHDNPRFARRGCSGFNTIFRIAKNCSRRKAHKPTQHSTAPSIEWRQQVVRDLEIGQPINSENCSETAEGVARESEDSFCGCYSISKRLKFLSLARWTAFGAKQTLAKTGGVAVPAVNSFIKATVCGRRSCATSPGP